MTSQRQQHLLAMLATGTPPVFTPVQIQKLTFLAAKRVPHVFGASFAHKAYDYGPFDGTIYQDLNELQHAGLVEIVPAPWVGREYRLNAAGKVAGQQLLASLDPQVRNYLSRLSSWIRSLSFADLVRAIYREYPEMRANSVFED